MNELEEFELWVAETGQKVSNWQSWQACAERKDAEIAALRKQLELFRKFAQTVYVRHGEYVMRQYRILDETGKPTKLLTGGE